MATRKPKIVLYRRRREGKTNYTRRLKLLLSGKPRLVVRLTNQRVIAQVVNSRGAQDQVLVATDSSVLKKLGWSGSGKNTPAAYLTGLLLGKKAVEKNVKEAIFDVGFKTSIGKGRLAAFLKGVLDGGMKIPYGSKEIFPKEERIRGEHIQDKKVKDEFEKTKNKIVS